MAGSNPEALCHCECRKAPKNVNTGLLRLARNDEVNDTTRGRNDVIRSIFRTRNRITFDYDSFAPSFLKSLIFIFVPRL